MSEVVNEDDGQTVTPVGYGSGHDKYDVMAAVASAISGKPHDFEAATRHILAAKMQDAVENKREEIASSVFAGPEQPEETDDSTEDQQSEDTPNEESSSEE